MSLCHWCRAVGISPTHPLRGLKLVWVMRKRKTRIIWLSVGRRKVGVSITSSLQFTYNIIITSLKLLFSVQTPLKYWKVNHFRSFWRVRNNDQIISSCMYFLCHRSLTNDPTVLPVFSLLQSSLCTHKYCDLQLAVLLKL